MNKKECDQLKSMDAKLDAIETTDFNKEKENVALPRQCYSIIKEKESVYSFFERC